VDDTYEVGPGKNALYQSKVSGLLTSSSAEDLVQVIGVYELPSDFVYPVETPSFELDGPFPRTRGISKFGSTLE
jgi:hypothetical protein